MSIALSLPPQAAFAAEMTAKATLVLLATAAVAGAVALRGGSAAARHLVWTLGVCGVLSLPLLSAALPGWRTPLLAIPAPVRAAPRTFTADPVVARPSSGSPGAGTRRTGADAAAPVITARRGGGTDGMELGTVAVAVYLLGVLAVLGRLALGRWSVARLGRQAERVEDGAWAGLLRDVSWALGVDRPVRLLRGGGATMPMTWGIVRPAVLLPAESAGWPEERRRVVLMHELAHVARHDCLTQTLATAACALYWFHPAAWHAARRLRVERELACDDRVLSAGTRPGDYAAHLLEVARAFRPAPLAGPVVVSMARPSQLEGRLLAVLDGVRNRGLPTRGAVSAATALALAVLLPLAAIRPGSAQRAVPAGVTFGGPKPWKDTTKTKPPRSSDAYPDLDAALRRGVVDVSISVRPGERLTLDLPDRVSARVEAWDRPSVHVRVDDPGLHVRAERVAGGAQVTVTGRPRTDGTTPHVRIQAPRSFSVHTEADGGGLEIGALSGTFTGSVTGGGLAFVGTRGTVRMTAHGGGAFISNAHLDGRLEMDGGGVLMGGNTGNLDVTGAAATAHGRPGRLRVDVPAAATTVRGADEGMVVCAGEDCILSVATGGSGRAASASAAAGAGSASAAAGPRGSVRASTANGTGVTVTTGAGGTTVTTTTWDGASTAPGSTASAQATSPMTVTGQNYGYGPDYAYVTGDVPGRIAAIRAMAREAPAPAAAAAMGLGRLAFTDPDAPVQRAAVEELARLRTRAATEQLRLIAREHPRSAVRAQAAEALR